MSPTAFVSVASNTTIYSPYGSTEETAGGRAVNSAFAASLTFLLWDILITMDDEIQLIWPRTWNYTKFVYFFVRYVPAIVQMPLLTVGSELTPLYNYTPKQCFIWQVFQGAAASALVLLVDTILCLRIFALYNGNIIIRYVVGFFFAVELVGMLCGLALGLPGIRYNDICLTTGAPRALFIYAAVALIFQTILFVLTLYKFIQAIRSGWGDVPLIKLLMRDGTWAFFLLFFAYVGQMGLYTLPKHKHSYQGLFFGWMLSLFSFCGYRIILNLNDLANITGEDQGNQQPVDTGTGIQFTSHVFDSHVDSEGQESYELSPRKTTPLVFEKRSSRKRKQQRLVNTTQISTLDLEK